jgi:hypothetical protein
MQLHVLFSCRGGWHPPLVADEPDYPLPNPPRHHAGAQPCAPADQFAARQHVEPWKGWQVVARAFSPGRFGAYRTVSPEALCP